jgi:acetyl-CoA carboxylase biotin carboxyl carrier protein
LNGLALDTCVEILADFRKKHRIIKDQTSMVKAPAAKGIKKTAAQKPVSSAKAVAKPTYAIDTDLVRAIAQLLTETNVGEIEVSKGDLKVRVARQSAAPAAAPALVAHQPVAAAAPVAVSVPLAKPVVSVSAEASAHPGAVKSPMVGTGYRKASPEAKNFVELGSVVKAGEKIMLIEAMKTFNDIVAPKAGTVTAILIEDGQPIEFGQTLFVIE